MLKHILFVLILATMMISTASALNIHVSPVDQELPIGGSVNYTVKVSVAAEKDIGDHIITITFYNFTTNNKKTETDKLNGSLSSTDVSVTEKKRTKSSIKYKWYANSEGNYTFNLTVWVNESATNPTQVGEEFKIYIEDNGKECSAKAKATVYATAVPEIATIALLGVGLVTLVVIKRKF